ncbi:MAG: hypothetical protein KL787_09990 [Taibaiella sp.]|nr:hypothetical protein [Taibaiella sp.]
MKNNQITLTPLQLVDIHNLVKSWIEKYDGSLKADDTIKICETENNTIEIFVADAGFIGTISK